MYKVPQLPLPYNLETKDIFKKLVHAHRALAELKGITEIIPIQSILINTLSLSKKQKTAQLSRT